MRYVSRAGRQCPYPGVPAGGAVTFDGSGFGYFDNATYTCLRSGFEPTPFSVLQCGVNETGNGFSWAADTPECVGERFCIVLFVVVDFVSCPAWL